MLYTENTKKAIKIMYKAHQNQVDKAGMPYVFHPWTVAENQEDEDRTVAALLHDVVEDTDMTIEQLQSEGFNDNVIEALKLLTHAKDEDYYEYIKRLSTNDIAIDVKLADLHHNSQLDRLEKIEPKDLLRAQKYEKCINYLKEKKEKKEDKFMMDIK